jgi:hypothetical protein
VKLVGDEAADEIGEGVEVVEPDAPEARETGGGDGDTCEGRTSQCCERRERGKGKKSTAEEGEDNKEERVGHRGGIDGRCESGNGLSHGDGEELGQEDPGD